MEPPIGILWNWTGGELQKVLLCSRVLPLVSFVPCFSMCSSQQNSVLILLVVVVFISCLLQLCICFNEQSKKNLLETKKLHFSAKVLGCGGVHRHSLQKQNNYHYINQGLEFIFKQKYIGHCKILGQIYQFCFLTASNLVCCFVGSGFILLILSKYTRGCGQGSQLTGG